jgi:hypothetical protein
MIPEQKVEAWNVTRQILQDMNNFDSKVKKQSDVGHIL